MLIRMHLNRDYCSNLRGRPESTPTLFDAKLFLACIGDGPSIGKSRKWLGRLFTKGTVEAVFYLLKISAVPRVPRTAVFLTRLATTTPFLTAERVAQTRTMTVKEHLALCS